MQRGAPPKAQPVSFEVSANRVGSAVVLNIVGVGRGQLEGQPFENPATWSITCRANGRSLQRVVNGSARVERVPVGPVSANRWDVSVRYTVGFAIPAGATRLAVDIDAPGAQPFNEQIPLELASL